MEEQYDEYSLNANTQDRIVHCSQLLYRVWDVWKREKIVINYINIDGKKVCKLSIKGSV